MQSEITANKAAANKLLGIQAVVTVITALLLYVFVSLVAAYSALLGGLTYIVPNVWFFRFVFRDSGQPAPHTFLSRLYAGEAVKLMFTAVVFALCFILVKQLHIGVLFLTYVIMIIINLAGLAKLSIKTL